ncbi:hypothetical protein AB870_03185 [Pandoraea faecigallinarum]|uniref:Uncharacterized protein n=1 Tax=Pandoraea faecigallinarum TaxID=656179 RepID=A0A0H3WPC9_9BURK|nr:hypothetical protein AB870_03185 [Pandoraea faecigallinarum]
MPRDAPRRHASRTSQTSPMAIMPIPAEHAEHAVSAGYAGRPEEFDLLHGAVEHVRSDTPDTPDTPNMWHTSSTFSKGSDTCRAPARRRNDSDVAQTRLPALLR